MIDARVIVVVLFAGRSPTLRLMYTRFHDDYRPGNLSTEEGTLRGERGELQHLR